MKTQLASSGKPSRLLVAAMLTLGMAASAGVWAGTCPADKVGANPLANAPTMPIGVVDTELASIDLSKENVQLHERRLRLRTMTIAPGGVVPHHSHGDRPALIKVNVGQIFENNSKCLVPILHKAGDVAREFNGTEHWWKNEGSVAVELTIGDIVNDHKPETMPPKM